MKEKFLEDLKALCALVQERDSTLNELFLKIDDLTVPMIKDVVRILERLHLENTSSNRLAALSRLVNLQEAAIIQVLKKNHQNSDDIKRAKEILFEWVRDHHTKCHAHIIEECEKRQLLTPFYRQILRGTHSIGQAFNAFHLQWKMRFIEGVNPALLKEYQGDESLLLKALESIKEVSYKGEMSDRSYSIPHKNGEALIAVPYAKAFETEVQEIIKEITMLLKALDDLEDEVFSAKDHYIAYYQTLLNALKQDKIEYLLESWREVDRAWMAIKTPIQPAHPLEYYEDHYRKAVAPEWDVRITHVSDYEPLPIKSQMQASFEKLYAQWVDDAFVGGMKKLVNTSLERTDVYLSLPALYYGADMDGLFSAQVIPNDEMVSLQMGKKIFAFPMRVLRLSQYRPFMKLTQEIFPQGFLKERRDILFCNERIWHELYQISTIGHEFGHIFWIDTDTELLMNKTGCFKNIEEFKATTGGLVNFFMNDHLKDYAPLRVSVLAEVIMRAVGLIAWMEQEEVLPYYCEGLIHLHILFEVGILNFNGHSLELALNVSDYERVKALYLSYYQQLADVYVHKQDAGVFLQRFTCKDHEGHFKPVDSGVRAFVEHYWNRYQLIGQEVQEGDEHKEYLKQNFLKRVS